MINNIRNRADMDRRHETGKKKLSAKRKRLNVEESRAVGKKDKTRERNKERNQLRQDNTE